ncbi:hypothetical protein ACP70R_001489 [Stipagrostis hirtigluma subsp. patula]
MIPPQQTAAMAASQRPIEKTESTCTAETARATHAFKIYCYSLHKGLGWGRFIRSGNFAVGGYDWCIRYCPDGDSAEDLKDYISVFLELRSKDAEVSAMHEFRLVNQATGLSSPISSSTKMVFKSHVLGNPCWGAAKFKRRSELEASCYLRDDRLVIECDVTVILGTPVSESYSVCEIQVPSPNLSDSFGTLLESEEGADVTFKVQEEVFHAHKLVLATRSPVFKAKLYGPLSDKKNKSITIEDMEPTVFKKLLHFIYTDSLPAMDHLDRDESDELLSICLWLPTGMELKG